MRRKLYYTRGSTNHHQTTTSQATTSIEKKKLQQQQDDSSSQQRDHHHRTLQDEASTTTTTTTTTTQVTEPCIGTNPLILTFTINVSYRTTNPSLKEDDSDLVITFPFSAVNFRTTYIDNYLKQGSSVVGVDNGNAGGFDSVYCTSRIGFDDDDDDDDDDETSTLTKAPSSFETTTLGPTQKPTMGGGDGTMTLAPGTTSTSSPTGITLSPAPSSQDDNEEVDMNNKTKSPAMLPTYYPSLTPTVSSSDEGNLTTSSASPTSSSVINGTLAPSSSLNGTTTSAPTPSVTTITNNGTLSPSSSSSTMDNITTTTASPTSSGTDDGSTTIVDILGDNQNFTTLMVALNAAGLVGALETGGPYTVFGTLLYALALPYIFCSNTMYIDILCIT